MPIALSSFAATAGLLFTFVIVLPIIAQGLIAVAVAQAMGERAENRRFVEEHAADHRRD